MAIKENFAIFIQEENFPCVSPSSLLSLVLDHFFFLTIAFIVSFPSTVTITIFLSFPSSSSNNQHHLHPHLLLLTFPIRGTTFPLDLAFYFCLYHCISELPLMRVSAPFNIQRHHSPHFPRSSALSSSSSSAFLPLQSCPPYTAPTSSTTISIAFTSSSPLRVMPFLLLLFPFLLIINTVSTALHPSPCCMT